MTATRVHNLEPEGAYHVLARAQELERQGRDIIHLEIGEPDFPTPAGVSSAGIEAIQENRTRYNPPRGITELREVVAKDAGTRRGIEIDPEKNYETREGIREINPPGTEVKILVIPTNEELKIAQETQRVITALDENQGFGSDTH